MHLLFQGLKNDSLSRRTDVDDHNNYETKVKTKFLKKGRESSEEVVRVDEEEKRGYEALILRSW